MRAHSIVELVVRVVQARACRKPTHRSSLGAWAGPPLGGKLRRVPAMAHGGFMLIRQRAVTRCGIAVAATALCWGAVACGGTAAPPGETGPGPESGGNSGSSTFTDSTATNGSSGGGDSVSPPSPPPTDTFSTDQPPIVTGSPEPPSPSCSDLSDPTASMPCPPSPDGSGLLPEPDAS